MNTETLDELWNSTANKPAAVTGEKIAAKFLSRLRARRRFQAWWLGWTLFALTVTTVLAIVSLLRSSAGADAWTMVLLLALPWFVALRFLREFFRDDAGTARAGRPLHDVLLSAQISNAGERRRLVIVVALFVVTVPLLALALWQLHISGKASLNEAWSMALVFGVALVLGACGIAWKFFRRLVPERRMIDALFRDLDDTSAR